MARLATCGFEANDLSGVGLDQWLLGNATGTSTVARDTSVFRSGVASMKCSTNSTNGTTDTQSSNITTAASTTYYGRAYVRFDTLPAATKSIVEWRAVGSLLLGIRVTSAGKLQLWDLQSNVQVGSDSSETVTAGDTLWYRLEISATLDGSKNFTGGSGQVNGTTLGTISGKSVAAATTITFDAGWIEASGTSMVLYLDDCAVNDSSGGSQNSFPGDGKIVLLIPTATSAGGTGWTDDNASSTGANLFAAVDNRPPLGIADTTSGGGGHQDRNATNNANSNLDMTMTTYSAAGIAAADTINVIDPMTVTAAPVTTSAKQGTVGVASNPAITNIALAAGGTSGAFWSGTAAGTYPTGWKISHGTVTYGSSVTVETAPVMRVTQVTGSNRVAMVCFMGMTVDYTPTVPAPPEPIVRVHRQAVDRAASW